MINFRNPAVGNAWNPLYIPYKFYINGDIDRASEFANDIANNLMVSERSSDDPFLGLQRIRSTLWPDIVAVQIL